MQMDQLVQLARSTRRFDESVPIGAAVLRALVAVARLSPCGGNLQKLRYRLVAQAAECAAVFPLVAWAAALKEWDGPAPGERPSGYIAVLGEGGAGVDTGIAAQTMQLTAAERGYGCCMLGSIKRDPLKALLRIPDPYEVQLLLALGRPAETIVLEEAVQGDNLAYYRTPDGVHHVPKLGLQDVLIEG